MARKSKKVVPLKRGRRPPAKPTVRRRGRKAGRSGWRLLAASISVFVVVLAAALTWRLPDGAVLLPGLDLAKDAGPAVQVSRVVDGDTLVLADGERVRILNIDTPEMPPRAQCDAERDLALAAKARLAELVAQGRVIVLVQKGEGRDVYGRQLRQVRVDGQDVGELLIREGLAEPWRGRKGVWC